MGVKSCCTDAVPEKLIAAATVSSGGNDDEASHGLFSGSGSSNSSNVGTRYVWYSWDWVFGRLSIPVPSRPGIAIYTYNIII
ncbi:hypothetical protein H0E87_010195 [Populus deltoides]|uniref:Uncharacterized protein n=1 Tax=Populus deltoides TaxID=3696 RepID=A0A8T2YS91_POPDE|nr:hypothetical protein H0E87_010195 [Populus deltoides]